MVGVVDDGSNGSVNKGCIQKCLWASVGLLGVGEATRNERHRDIILLHSLVGRDGKGTDQTI